MSNNNNEFVDTLVDMGFDRAMAFKALEATGNLGVQPAMDWILANPNVPVGKEGNESQAESSEVVKDADDGVVRSYKCEDCNRQFTSTCDLEYHAAKTGHSNFSESNEEKRELTAEERAAQLKLLQVKMQQRKQEREEKEKKEAIDREKQRMKSGKEMGEARRRLEEREMKEIAEARRREKADEKKARDRVKAQIEADKAARREKFGGGSSATPPPTEKPPVASTTSGSNGQSHGTPQVKKEYIETKIQIRFPNGSTLTQTFKVGEPLAAVRLFVQLNRTDGEDQSSIKLQTAFPPRRVFQDESDYQMPLSALGLVPSAVLMLSKCK